jgi:DNA-binding MarR family transcriptional regulator
MALTTCRECKREVSSVAKACPHCGAPNPDAKNSDDSADENDSAAAQIAKSAGYRSGYPWKEQERRDRHLRAVLTPAFLNAKVDHSLRGAPIIVYLGVLDRLTVGRFTALPQLALCKRLKYSERTVRGALRRLIERGYLRCRAGKSNGPREYCLEYEQRAPAPKRKSVKRPASKHPTV